MALTMAALASTSGFDEFVGRFFGGLLARRFGPGLGRAAAAAGSSSAFPARAAALPLRVALQLLRLGRFLERLGGFRFGLDLDMGLFGKRLRRYWRDRA
jgi:hypothetical protein